jgi:1,6-anhydro-N-acetylmuramate kinase
MTGTSLDGLDVALVRILGHGTAMRAEVVGTASREFPGHDENQTVALRAIADGRLPSNQVPNIARWLSLFHADVIEELLRAAGVGRPDLVSVHGQTVFHSPPASWQLFNPWPLAGRIGAPLVFDLRGADLAAGGQGAPITPLADWILFRTPLHPLAVVNLGGFCNITFLPAASGETEREIGAIRARDVCACNHVLDQVAREALGKGFDEDGEAAARGRSHDDAAGQLVERLSAQSRSGRSLGTGDETREWVRSWRTRMAPDDLAATAVAALGTTISGAINEHAGAAALLAGGGVKNRALRSMIEARSRVARGSEAMVPMIEYREAVAMAVLGALSQDRVPITLPQVTGVPAPAPVAGCWVYP